MSCNRPVCGRRTDVRRKVCPNGYNRRISDRRMTGRALLLLTVRFAELLETARFVILVRAGSVPVFPLRKTRLELPICSIVPTSVVRTERPVPETTGIVTVRTVFPHGTVVARKIRVVRCARTAVRRVLRIGGITLQTRATLDTLRRGNTRPLIAPEAGQRRIRVVLKSFIIDSVSFANLISRIPGNRNRRWNPQNSRYGVLRRQVPNRQFHSISPA